jgi:type II secretory pathway pseudopilin PulG
MRPGRRGLALLVVAGVLGILAVLAAAFVTLAQLERRASRQRLYATQAELLARSGLEDALARLSAGQVPSYEGEDWDADGALSAFEKQQEVFKPGTLQVEECPARQALRPSFFADDGTGKPKYAPVEGRQRGHSGILPGGSYALKIEDESAKINVNGGFLDAQDRDNDTIKDYHDPDVREDPGDPKDTGLGWNFQLARILDVLGQQPEVAVPGLGSLRLIPDRPEGGYASIGAMNAVAGKDLSAWLAISSWADTRVVHPTAWPDATTKVYDSLSAVKMRRNPLRLEEGGRSPVNLNAASLPILKSLLLGLIGIWAELEKSDGNNSPNQLKPRLLPPATASGVAGAILAQRPFRSWGEFEAFIDGLVPSVINVSTGKDYLNQQVADLIKANLNPNTLSNKEYPDQLNFHWIDKTDLAVWSTEGCLEPTGTFLVAAIGRILDAQGRLLAEASRAQRVEAYTLVRESTQKDFVGDRKILSSYLSVADDPAQRTAGAQAAWKDWPGPQGLAVMTYPAPPMAFPPGNAAEQDGAIGLATVEAWPIPAQVFVHHLDDGWEGDTPGVLPWVLDPMYGSELQADTSRPLWPDTAQDFPWKAPATLYPDGVGVQKRQCVAYDCAGVFPRSLPGPPVVNWGVFSYWMKPYKPKRLQSNPGAHYDLGCLFWGGWTAGPPGGSLSQLVGIGRSDQDVSSAWGMVAESGSLVSDAKRERRWQHYLYQAGGRRIPGLRWQLITAGYNDGTQTPGLDVFFDRRGILPTSSDDLCPGYSPYEQGITEVLARPGARFSLGIPEIHKKPGDGGSETPLPSQPSVVLDEVCLYDFGPGPAKAKALALDQASLRYRDGRYYKGNAARDAGAFLSAIQDPGGERRLLRASWTESLPQEKRKELHIPDGPSSGWTPPWPSTGLDRDIEPALKPDASGNPRAWIEVDLMGAGAGLGDPALARLCQGKPLSKALAGFRYRVRFKVALENPLNDPVLESPWFHDITFQVSRGPKVLSWE